MAGRSSTAGCAAVRTGVAALVASLVLAGCSASGPSSGPPYAPPTPSSLGSPPTPISDAPSGPTPSAPPSSPPTLPRRPDGFGEVGPTPPDLVDRRLPTVDRLPPPASGRYESTISALASAQVARSTWRPGCPVAPDRLRRLTMSFRGFDGRAHTGEMIVRDDVAPTVVDVFGRLFAAGFPIEEMRPVTPEDLAAPPTGVGDNTASFACRPATGQTRFSAHAYGLAVDVDPFQNPLHRRDGLVVPELASAYLDRADHRPGMIRDGDVVVDAFARHGWTWGGRFTAPIDTMHFSATGD